MTNKSYEVSSLKEISKLNSVILINIQDFSNNMEKIIKQNPEAKIGIFIAKQKIQKPDKIDLIINMINNLDEKINSRIDQLEIRLDGLETRLDGLETRLNGLETRLDGLEKKVDQGFKLVNARIDNLVIKNNLKE